jgi:hypothetical protein
LTRSRVLEHMPKAPDSAPNLTPSALQRDILSFARHCRAGNLSPKTAQTYTESARRLAEYLAEQGMPSDIGAIRREHIESFITDQLGRHKATTAHNRYRGVQAFFRWALDEGLVKDSPMARMRPPRLPEAPPPILREAELHALTAACERDATFAGRRDAAIVRIFLDNRRAAVGTGGAALDPDNDLSNDVDLDPDSCESSARAAASGSCRSATRPSGRSIATSACGLRTPTRTYPGSGSARRAGARHRDWHR